MLSGMRRMRKAMGEKVYDDVDANAAPADPTQRR